MLTGSNSGDRRVLEADCELTDRGVDAAETISEELEQMGPEAARQLAEEVYGWKRLGTGVARQAYETPSAGPQQQVAFELPASMRETTETYVRGTHDCVVKVATPRHGQTATEIAQWRAANGERGLRAAITDPADGDITDIRPYLAPISDYDRDANRYLVMRQLETRDRSDTRDAAGGLRGEIQDETGWVMTDIHEDNVGFHRDVPYIIDYGHEVVWSGSTPAQRVDAFEDALENAGVRDIFTRPHRIGQRQTFFRHPLDLPGLPYETEESEVRTTRDGRLLEMELFGSLIPTAAATRIEVENALDEVVDTSAILRNTTVEVEGFPQGWLPKARATGRRGKGAPLSEIEAFVTEFYDRYRAIFAGVIPDDFEPDTDVEQDLQDDIEGAEILDEIEDEVNDLVEQVEDEVSDVVDIPDS